MTIKTGYKSTQDPSSAAGSFNAIQFIVRQMMNRASIAALVQIKKVTNAGGVSPVGYVDVVPLVGQVDGYGQEIPHGILHGLPYFRLQGGANAVIIDPVVGDIGIAVFSDVDISVAKTTKKSAVPGSRRRFDMADGMYLGGVLNAAPTSYIQFQGGNITITGAANVNINGATAVNVSSSAINLQDTGVALQKLVNESFMTLFNTHTHSSSGAGVPNTPMTNANLTAITKAE
ncbi:MAG TPA: oxidoreductase [Candidatus Paceibacterota bacterium]